MLSNPAGGITGSPPLCEKNLSRSFKPVGRTGSATCMAMREMFPGVFQHLHLFAVDPYDLALTKLERNIERDRGDVRHLARTVPFDLNILQERYTAELRPYLGNPTREDLTLKLWIEDIEQERS